MATRSGYVLFPNRTTLDTHHLLAIEHNGLPWAARRTDGRLDPTGKATVNVVNSDYFHTNHVNPLDPQILVYIEEKWWPPALLSTYTFYTKDDPAIQNYLPQLQF
jgi:hypothetical protein